MPDRAESTFIHLALLLVTVVVPVRGIHAQDVTVADSLALIVDGAQRPWPSDLARSSLHDSRWRSALVDRFREGGFFSVRIDSVHSGVAVYVSKGPVAQFDTLIVRYTGAEIDHVPVIDPSARADTLTRPGLDTLLREVLRELSGIDRLGASGRVDSLVPVNTSAEARRAYAAYVSVNPGPVVRVSDVALVGDTRSSLSLAFMLAGVRTNERTGQVELTNVRSSVLASGLYPSVGEPSWILLSDSTARLVIPVEAGPPGTFDLTLGVLPGSEPDGRARLVGSGSIDLNNAFGAGRRFDLLLDRRPGQTSHVNAGASDPFVAGYPIRVDLRFDGLQQDSTWSTRKWSAAAAYRFGVSLDDLELGVRYTREVTRPGQAGLALSGGAQRIARSEASFWGVEVALNRVDDLVSPRSGVILQSTLERGLSTYRRRVVESGDTTRVAVGDRRERMSLSFRGHIPAGPVISFVAGGDISILSADDVDESDLFRIGGASSLRGYDEDRFRGTTIGRALIEVRSRFEDRSFASVFLDIGYVDRPQIRDIEEETGWHPGFGIGVQFTAPVGIMNVSYALGGRGGLGEGRVHVGVRFGL